MRNSIVCKIWHYIWNALRKINSMRIFRYLSIIAFLLIANLSFADHIVGYDMCLINVKNPDGTGTNSYYWRLKIYRDVLGIPIPGSATFQMYKLNDNSSVGGTFICNKINAQTFLTYPPEDCAPPQAQLSIEVGIYQSAVFDYSGLNNPAGYYVTSSTCCRNIGIANVLGNSSTFGITFTMEIPRLNSTAPTKFNSSPEFKKNPLTLFCVGKPYTLDWNVTDPDKDSMVFSLAQPLSSGTVKPIDLIPYASGYNINYNIIDGVPDISINSKTGVINFIPTRTGKYLVAFKVEEYRKINGVPTKIGEIRREYQLEALVCLEAPPVTEDNNNQKRIIVDTINFPNDYTVTFTSRDSPTDSIFMYIVPNISPGENLLDPNKFDAKWGEIGSLTSGITAENLVIDGIALVRGQFTWKPKCTHVRDKPYKFTVVVRDKTCPSPFYDSTFVTLYVKKKENISPMFTNKYLGQGDTIKVNTPVNKITKRYFIRAGDTFQLAADSIIKTYDKDSAQVVNIKMEPDPANGTAINNNLIFSVTQNTVHTTATFRWVSTCADKLDNPIKVRFLAYDDDCLSPDTVAYNIEINVKDQPNKKPIYAKINPDTVRIAEGTIDSFYVVVYDSLLSVNINKYKNITLYPDTSDFNDVIPLGGVPIQYSSVNASDSLKVKFVWRPTCANVRQEPYKLYLRTSDEGCPTINNFDTIYVYAMGPYNSAPEFRDPLNNTIKVIDTTIYGGDAFNFNLFAVDTNQRFDSVYIYLNPNSDIANPTLVKNTAYVISVNGKDSARTALNWNSTCSDIRSTPYIATVVARDNECVNPEINELIFNITVRERPNYLPKFTFAPTNETVLNLYAGETFNIDLTALDTGNTEYVTIDSVYTNIPFNLPKPTINRVYGLAYDTLKTNLNWFADCSLIRDDPYYIKVAAWDGACRNPQDSAVHTFKIYVLKNPDLSPNFLNGKDTVIELVAGEKFKLELTSSSVLAGDSILISSIGDVYGGIPGNLAKFEQTNVQGSGTAVFNWETSCDQIRDSSYTVFFTTSNPPCQTPEVGFRIKFKVIPNTDVVNPIPNVFSPNGDNINDKYSIVKQYKVYCDPGFKFTIFNRWGKIVFESTNPEFEWDAEGLGSGTYFYTLESRARAQNGTIDIIK